MERIKISAPVRLNFGLLDMNDQIGRIDSGIGLADEPNTVIEAEKSDHVQVECKDEPEIVDWLSVTVKAVCL